MMVMVSETTQVAGQNLRNDNLSILEDQEDEHFPNLNGINCNDYISVHNKGYDSDDGGGEEPLSKILSLVRQVPPELLEHS